MTVQEIKQAVDDGKTVHYQNGSYTVVKNFGDYLIKHTSGHMIGLTWSDDITLNGKEEDFYEVAIFKPSDSFMCLVIKCGNIDITPIVSILEEDGIVCDSFDKKNKEIFIGLEGLKESEIDLYDIFWSFDSHKIDYTNFNFTLEKISM
jgi:hypothetical protein